MFRMVAYSRRLQSGQITCYLNRTYHVLLTSRTISLDDSEHFLHYHRVSVASLRLLFTCDPECRSASLRNRCSPSPEYPGRGALVRRTEPPAMSTGFRPG